ncbi:HEAT repeat domain-containing protein [Streptomyces luteolifulvus]|jgi:hypothetical protein|uniref:HEAT repeat domain-containing protein n=1 Tax=Streptomyces luteolifulvus TaxID=2615112 RepID=A0A6H9VA93_9ACTN|nr:HEAT repeat domain-containing protein [Streptomyces luteolifulvus]KAB1150552.1 HEAT repeat domain-containing protein [Streptomyces luteolifulvus]
MTGTTERLVIKPSCTSDDVDFVSMQRGWILKKAQIQEAGAYVDSWVTLDRKTEIHLVDDRPIGTRYFTLHGPGSAEIARQIREDCDVWSAREALADLRGASTRDEKLRAVFAAAVSATEADADDLIREFGTAARDSDAGVRQSVIIATGYFPHPGLVDLVGELRDGDPVEHVRRNAQILLDGLSEGN